MSVRPYVVFMPTTPQREDAIRFEPDVYINLHYTLREKKNYRPYLEIGAFFEFYF